MNTQRSKRPTLRRAALAAAATVTAAVLLSACGSGGHEGMDMGDSGDSSASSSESAPASAEEHNAADVEFAQAMIPHHEQAVEMADLAVDQASSEEVRTLAEEIRDAQNPEIETLTGWLEDWGEEVPDGGMDHGGMDMGDDDMDMGMDGMMSEEELTELENATGAAFDEMFLEMMIEHHRGAVEMAETEQAEGSYQPALDMAEDIIATQNAEIDQMNGMLGQD